MFGWKHQQNSHQANTEFSRTRLEMNDSQLKEFVWYLWTRGCFMFKSNLFKYVALVKWAGNNRTFYEMRNPAWSEVTGRIVDGENSWDGCMLYLSYWDWHCIKPRSFSSSFQKNSEVNDIHNDKTFMVTIWEESWTPFSRSWNEKWNRNLELKT